MSGGRKSSGITKEDIAAGLVESIAQRVSVMAKQIGLRENVAGRWVAKNAGIKVKRRWKKS